MKYKFNIPVKRSYVLAAMYCCLALFAGSCEKALKLKYDSSPPRQVIIANLSPDNKLKVNISKSKSPNDISPVEFLQNCKVDLYEDSIFKETMMFKLTDTASGIGSYYSSFKLQQNKTYKIISTHPDLGTAQASEYLPSRPIILNVNLTQHADSAHPNATGKFDIIFLDSVGFQNYYYINMYYQVLKPVVDEHGDTTYVYDYLPNIALHAPQLPNNENYTRIYFTDNNFNGNFQGYSFEFNSQYNTIYKEITMIVELSNLGPNYYNYYTQQLPVGEDFLNEGQEERANIISNIVNGYGHFTGNSSSYWAVRIR